MNTVEFVPIDTLCSQYTVEYSFFHGLNEYGLITIEFIEEQQCLPLTALSTVEKMLRLHQDLEVNLEGIDVVFNLLQRIEALQEELQVAKNRLQRYGDISP